VLVGEPGGRRIAGLLAAVATALLCALALPALAAAESFEVNSTADAPDLLPGDATCLTAGGKCTLRAAIEQANGSEGEFDVVGFDEVVFDGKVAGTITLGASLPAIDDPIAIEGECVVDEVLRPCVGVDGPGPSAPALTVEDTEEVEIDGLAISGAETGIEVLGSPRFKALSDWLGVKLDGSPGGNETGILVGPGSNRSRIGSEGVTNVFANNSGDGLDVLGASNVRVLGGYFGVEPDGVTPAANGGDIEVASDSGSGLEATGTAIGTQLAPKAAASPACDGGCNVISGSGSSGIDLEGDGGEETPAAATVIAGNYVGLDASGTAAVPSVGDGIHVGQAARTVIGGPRASEANRFAGGETAVLAGPGAANLVVHGNSIGVDGNGAGSVAAPDDGIVVNSEGLPSAAAEAVIVGNEIRMQGGVGIDQTGLGGWISDNLISGADTGIDTSESTEEHGNLIEENAIEGSALNGILIENGSNEILGNEVLGSDGAGIRIEGKDLFFGFGVSGNLIGGDDGASENLIANGGAAAIEISNPEAATNEVARNWGFANDGPFIDLVAADPNTEPKGPNGGVQPPAFKAVSQLGASGSAQPGARIRVFRKADPSPGELESFLGEATADEEGEWEVVYAEPISPTTSVAATQTSEAGGTSELAFGVTEGGLSGGSPTACPAAASCTPPPSQSDTSPSQAKIPAPPGQSDTTPPQTKILEHPKKRSGKTTARFGFDADESAATFSCRLDEKPFKACGSPRKYKRLKPGKHVFQVRATDPSGNVDPSPAKYKFVVLG
jgi:CSLREA domain-containing protein